MYLVHDTSMLDVLVYLLQHGPLATLVYFLAQMLALQP